MISRRLFAASCYFFVAAISASAADEHTKVPLPKVVEQVTKKQASIIDVREPEEWDRGHLQAAHSFPMSVLKRASTDETVQESLAKSLPKDKPVYCHCAKGVRALIAAEMLTKLGYDVRPLAAGYHQLVQAGFEPAKLDKK